MICLNLLLFQNRKYFTGGGFALAEGAKVSGVSNWLKGQMKVFDALPHMVVVFIVGILSEFLTNFTANVAVANIVLPVASEMVNNI